MNMWMESLKAEDTFGLGKRLGESAKAGEVYLLHGEMGAGKTVFAQGFAQGLGIREPVSSPTFTILHEYDSGRLPLYHFDAYRVEDASEMEDVGYGDYLYGQGVCLVEWADRIKEFIPSHAKEVFIEKDPGKGFEYRKIMLPR